MKYLIKDFIEARWVFTLNGFSGWTKDINEASRYSREEAERLIEGYPWLLGDIVDSPGDPAPAPPKPPTFDEKIKELEQPQISRTPVPGRVMYLGPGEAITSVQHESRIHRVPERWQPLLRAFKQVWPDCLMRVGYNHLLMATQIELRVGNQQVGMALSEPMLVSETEAGIIRYVVDHMSAQMSQQLARAGLEART